MWLYSLHIGLLAKELDAVLKDKLINEVFADHSSGRIYFSIGKPSDATFLQYAKLSKSCRLNIIDNLLVPPKSMRQPLPVPFLKYRIVGCEQIRFDRIIRFNLVRELDERMHLYFILISSHPSVVAVLPDSENIRWSSTSRRATPGQNFVTPVPPPLPSPLEITREYIMSCIDSNPTLTLTEWLTGFVRGIDSKSASQIASHLLSHKGGEGGRLADFRMEELIEYLHSIQGVVAEGRMAIEYDGLLPQKLFIKLPTSSVDANTKTFESPSSAVEEFGRLIDDRVSFAASKNNLQDILRKEISRSEKLQKELLQAREEYSNAKLYREFGDLLLINLKCGIIGNQEARVKNIFDNDEPEITIPIDPRRSIPDNAAIYYQRHKKAKRGLQMTIDRISGVDARIERMRRTLTRLNEIQTIEDLRAVDNECQELGIIALKGPPGKEKTKSGVGRSFRRYDLEDGAILYVGRDNKENDELTFGFAAKHDLWFHAQQAHGSHIILKRPHRNYEFPQNIILQAASIAAHFSKARNSSAVPVVYTEVRYVRKPRGAAPGKAIYSHEKSILVPPMKPMEKNRY